jgi:hypothetical protein
VARQVARVCEGLGGAALDDTRAPIEYFTSGPVEAFGAALDMLGIEGGPITPVHWRDDERVVAAGS